MTMKKLVAPSLPTDGQVACSQVRCRHPFDIEIKSDGSRYKTCPRCRAKERKRYKNPKKWERKAEEPQDGQVSCSVLDCRRPFDIECKSNGSLYKTCQRCRDQNKRLCS